MAVARAANTNITITSPSNPLVESPVEEPAGGSDTLTDTDISGKEFRYNPPMHSANLHRRVDLSNDGGSISSVYDEGGAPRNYTETWANKNLNDLRLGRIIQHHLAPGHTSLMKYRWGFRFLYNPTSLTFASSRNDSFVIDGRSESNRAISGVNQNYQTVIMNLLLDRVPDVMADSIKGSDYSPALRKNDKDGLRKFGTHWDLEALFKVCNGEWKLTDRGRSSNLGVLIPSNARLILGKGDNLYGFVEAISYNDILFSQDMVPIRTEVSLTFRRHVDMSADQVEISFPGIGSIGTGEDETGSSDNGSVGNNKNAPLPGYNKVTRGFWAHGGAAGWGGWEYGSSGVNGKPVHATHGGKVSAVRYLTTSYGRHVIVTSGNMTMIYAHMSSINPNLRVGQSVSTGDWIGRVGSTGNSSGPHLHYEERLNGTSRMPIFANNTGKVR